MGSAFAPAASRRVARCGPVPDMVGAGRLGQRLLEPDFALRRRLGLRAALLPYLKTVCKRLCNESGDDEHDGELKNNKHVRSCILSCGSLRSHGCAGSLLKDVRAVYSLNVLYMFHIVKRKIRGKPRPLRAAHICTGFCANRALRRVARSRASHALESENSHGRPSYRCLMRVLRRGSTALPEV